MPPTFCPKLVNGPFEDPALFIPFSFHKRALLFDMGDLQRLPPREILKISHAFVTHTHMDHFEGFDRLLRVFLGRKKTLHLFGPSRFLRNVEGKLAGYTWNLVQNYEESLSLKVTEVHPDHTLRRVYRCSDGFSPGQFTESSSFSGRLLTEPSFSVEAAHLDHGIPCLAFSLVERFRVSIVKEGLKRLGLPVGPWLGRFKEALYQGEPSESEFHVLLDAPMGDKRTFCLGELAEQIAQVSPGQKIAYVVDALFSKENADAIRRLAHEADHLFIEGAFLEAHRDVAQRKYHLTAKQAGTLAREAAAKDFTPFHFSPRYEKTPDLLYREAHLAFEGRQGH